ncbi:MAG: stage II sporulation protein M [Firmicutes bacterium]|nr:stage II sporulation protein M [Bacillota bacterium]
MNKKIFLFLSFLLMVSFSAGVFVRFLATDQVSLSAEDITFWQGLWSGWKNDLTMTLAALLCSLSVYAMPFLILLVTAQTFTMGFSAAWLLASHPQGFLIVCTIFLPRCLIKLPAYLVLTLLSLENAKARSGQRRQKRSLQPHALCLVFLMFSSLLEAVLHLLIVSP